MFRLYFVHGCQCLLGIPEGSVVKNPPANAGDARDAGSILGSGRSSGRGHGSLLQCSCLGNPMGRGAWQATVHGASKSQTQISNREHAPIVPSMVMEVRV